MEENERERMRVRGLLQRPSGGSHPPGERLLQEPVCARVREPGLETLGSGVVPTSVKRGHQSHLHRVM